MQTKMMMKVICTISITGIVVVGIVVCDRDGADGRTWPPPSDRPAWRIKVMYLSSAAGLERAQQKLVGADFVHRRHFQEDIEKWKERVKEAETAHWNYTQMKYTGRSEQLASEILADIEELANYKRQEDERQQLRHKEWDNLDAAVVERDLPRAWRSLRSLGESHGLFVAGDVAFWNIHMRASLLSRDFKLLTWSAENVLLIDPTDGEAFFYKLLGIGEDKLPDTDVFKSAFKKHSEGLTSREFLEFAERYHKMFKEYKQAVRDYERKQ